MRVIIIIYLFWLIQWKSTGRISPYLKKKKIYIIESF